MLKLIFPNETHKKMWENCIKNWGKPGDPSFLFRGDSYEEFLKNLRENL